MNANELIEACDLSVFKVESQTTPGDRRTLLQLQNIARRHFGTYVYMEVGSHLGGTLSSHLLDPRCRLVVSIDSRPAAQPDERAAVFEYRDNSTRRMIEGLARVVPAGDLLKLVTFDGEAKALTDRDVPLRPQLVFIDGEHTNRAVVADFLAVKRFAEPSAIFAFHDSHLVTDGLLNIAAFLDFAGERNQLLFLPDYVAVIMTGGVAAMMPPLARIAHNADLYVAKAKAALQRQIAVNVAKQGATG